MWILLVLLYGLLKGIRDVVKKLALKKSSTIEVLLVYTLLSFLIVIPTSKDAFLIDTSKLLPIAFKSFVVFVAWICSFEAIKKLPVSLVGVLDLSRVLFATSLGVLVLKETMRGNQYIGLFLVCIGLLSLKMSSTNGIKNDEDVKAVYILMVLASCILNATSGLMDKILMKSVTSGQLQFWYMGFLVIYYSLFALIRKQKISINAFKNVWIWLLAILFVIGDRSLFIANADPASKVTVMTLVKQSACLVTIIGGKFIFKEKHIIKKILCAAVVVAGICIAAYK